MTRLFVFPGQGSQHPGMGKDWYENFSEAKLAFEEASDGCSLDLKKLCFEGSEEDLKATHITQPALLTTSVAIFRSLKNDQDIDPSKIIFAGHSLGEYSALVSAGALSLAEAARIVKKRGELMQKAVPAGLGAMAALIFKPGTHGETAAQELCAQATQKSGKSVSVANFNSPEQVVISGYKEAVSAAEELSKTLNLGVRKVVMLNVSAPFHCELMKPAAEGLWSDLESASWTEQNSVKYIPNTIAEALLLSNSKDCASRLKDQITGSVKWSQSMKWALGQNISEHLEVGAGSVLSGLMKRISAVAEKSEGLLMTNTATLEAYLGRNKA